MSFEVGTNSWISVSNADTYFNDIWDGQFWSSLSNNEKQQLLVTACYWILSSGYSVSMTDTADVLKKAQCELAIEVYNSYSEYKKRATLIASGVKSFNFNGWSETLTGSELPDRIQNLLKDYDTGKGGVFFDLERNY